MDFDKEIAERYYNKNLSMAIVGAVIVVGLLVGGFITYHRGMIAAGYEYVQVPTGETRGEWVKRGAEK